MHRSGSSRCNAASQPHLSKRNEGDVMAKEAGEEERSKEQEARTGGDLDMKIMNRYSRYSKYVLLNANNE